MRIAVLAWFLLTCARPLCAVSLVEWLAALDNRSSSIRAPLLVQRDRADRASEVYQLERAGQLPAPAGDGDHAYLFGGFEPVRGVEVLDAATGLPWLLLVSTEQDRPRKIVAAVPLSRGADARLLIVPENLIVTPEPRIVSVHDTAEGLLAGRFFRILDAIGARGLRDIADPASVVEAGNDTGEYLSPPGSTGFTAQMAYYHLSTARRRLEQQRIPVPDMRAQVFVNVAGLNHGIYQRRAAPMLAFGQKPGSDADIIYHEYGHAVLDGINPELLIEGESSFASAFHEAFGDIVAYALTGGSRIGEYGGRAVRNIQNTAHYPGGCMDPKLGRFEPHVASRVISGIFFDMSVRIGRMRALALFAEVGRRLPGSASFMDIRDAAVEVAAEVVSPEFAIEMMALFEQRGITAEDLDNEAAMIASERLVLRSGTGRVIEELPSTGVADVVVEAELRGARAGYNMLADIELIGPAGFEKTAAIINGRWPATNGALIAPTGRIILRGAPAGAYQMKARIKIGGNPRIYTLTRAFTVRD